MKSLNELTPAELRTVADLKEQIDTISERIADILVGKPCCDGACAPSYDPAMGERPPKKLHWTQTPEGKRRMSRIQRKAWRNGDRRHNMETGGV